MDDEMDMDLDEETLDAIDSLVERYSKTQRGTQDLPPIAEAGRRAPVGTTGATAPEAAPVPADGTAPFATAPPRVSLPSGRNPPPGIPGPGPGGPGRPGPGDPGDPPAAGDARRSLRYGMQDTPPGGPATSSTARGYGRLPPPAARPGLLPEAAELRRRVDMAEGTSALLRANLDEATREAEKLRAELGRARAAAAGVDPGAGERAGGGGNGGGSGGGGGGSRPSWVGGARPERHPPPQVDPRAASQSALVLELTRSLEEARRELAFRDAEADEERGRQAARAGKARAAQEGLEAAAAEIATLRARLDELNGELASSRRGRGGGSPAVAGRGREEGAATGGAGLGGVTLVGTIKASPSSPGPPGRTLGAHPGDAATYGIPAGGDGGDGTAPATDPFPWSLAPPAAASLAAAVAARPRAAARLLSGTDWRAEAVARAAHGSALVAVGLERALGASEPDAGLVSVAAAAAAAIGAGAPGALGELMRLLCGAVVDGAGAAGGRESRGPAGPTRQSGGAAPSTGKGSGGDVTLPIRPPPSPPSTKALDDAAAAAELAFGLCEDQAAALATVTETEGAARGLAALAASERVNGNAAAAALGLLALVWAEARGDHARGAKLGRAVGARVATELSSALRDGALAASLARPDAARAPACALLEALLRDRAFTGPLFAALSAPASRRSRAAEACAATVTALRAAVDAPSPRAARAAVGAAAALLAAGRAAADWGAEALAQLAGTPADGPEALAPRLLRAARAALHPGGGARAQRAGSFGGDGGGRGAERRDDADGSRSPPGRAPAATRIRAPPSSHALPAVAESLLLLLLLFDEPATSEAAVQSLASTPELARWSVGALAELSELAIAPAPGAAAGPSHSLSPWARALPRFDRPGSRGTGGEAGAGLDGPAVGGPLVPTPALVASLSSAVSSRLFAAMDADELEGGSEDDDCVIAD